MKRVEENGGPNSNQSSLRPRRAAYEAAVNMLSDDHKKFKEAKAAEAKMRNLRNENGELVVDMLPKKDTSVKLIKVYEFQFFDDYEGLQLLC